MVSILGLSQETRGAHKKDETPIQKQRGLAMGYLKCGPLPSTPSWVVDMFAVGMPRKEAVPMTPMHRSRTNLIPVWARCSFWNLLNRGKKSTATRSSSREVRKSWYPCVRKPSPEHKRALLGVLGKPEEKPSHPISRFPLKAIPRAWKSSACRV